MPLFVVSVPSSGRQVIVNAGSRAQAIQTAQSFVGGPADARPATYVDVQSIPLLGSVIQGDSRPAIQADRQFVASFGLDRPPQVAQPVVSPPEVQPPMGATAGPAATRTFASEETGLGRTGAFRRALERRGLDLGTLAGGSILGQQGQFEDVFDALQAFGRTPGGERAFEEFAGAEPFLSPFTQAQNLFGELGSLEDKPGEDLGAELLSILRPSTEQEIGGTTRLAGAALRGRVGAFSSNPFLNAVLGRLPGEFAQQTAAQQAATPFFKFARARLGLL